MIDVASRNGAGGRARAARLSPERRQEIARLAAVARYSRRQIDGMPKAASQGTLPIGDTLIDVYVLEDRRRLIHKRGMARALGLKSDGGSAFMKTISRKGLGYTISPELRHKLINPIIFMPLAGDPAHGYQAEIFIEVCDAILEAKKLERLSPKQLFLAIQAEFIIRAAAKIGIIGLIDEATGFIVDKRKDEYRLLWQEFIRDEFRQWLEPEFPDELFGIIYKLYGLKRFNPDDTKHPKFFGKFLRKYVYQPMANSNGAILAELDLKNPVVYANGGRRYKLFQFLSDEIGMPALRQHIWKTVGIGLSVGSKETFDRAFYNAFPAARPIHRYEMEDLFSILNENA